MNQNKMFGLLTCFYTWNILFSVAAPPPSSVKTQPSPIQEKIEIHVGAGTGGAALLIIVVVTEENAQRQKRNCCHQCDVYRPC
ncbi:hypothetical protein MAR_013712 [Mya arenaria]|uniref:Secreted protein n=1 Tax=Mya arenaria TaxID=6604 RepID=A0ABY7G0M4_MYAAR|nr:hypothetical protein MAR_013712 [Mya arenaria]